MNRINNLAWAVESCLIGINIPSLARLKGNRKQVFCIDDDRTFESVSDCALFYKVKYFVIRNACRRKDNYSFVLSKKFKFLPKYC